MIRRLSPTLLYPCTSCCSWYVREFSLDCKLAKNQLLIMLTTREYWYAAVTQGSSKHTLFSPPLHLLLNTHRYFSSTSLFCHSYKTSQSYGWAFLTPTSYIVAQLSNVGGSLSIIHPVIENAYLSNQALLVTNHSLNSVTCSMVSSMLLERTMPSLGCSRVYCKLKSEQSQQCCH